MPENQSSDREILTISNREEMSLSEHHLIGSGIPIRGKLFTAETVPPLIKRARDGDTEARIQVLTPAFIQNHPSEQARVLVEKARQADRERLFPQGYITALETEQMMAILGQGLGFYLELSELDQSGLVLPNWKFFIVDSQGKLNHESKTVAMLNRQQIAPEFSAGFSLGSIKMEHRNDKPIFYRTIQLNLGS